MKPVDNASVNNKFVYDTSKLSEQELKFFNSIFSASVNDNNTIEASDFVDYKAGANSFIDNLINTGAEWTKTLVDKIILSKNATQKSENKEFFATATSVLFSTKDKSNDENLENIIEYLNVSTRQLNLGTTKHELVRYLRSNNPEVVKILITALNNKKENPDFIKLLLQDYKIDASRLRYELEQLADKDGRSGNSIISDDLIIGDTLDKYKNQSTLENINSTNYTERKNEVVDKFTSVNKNTALAVLALMDMLDDELKEINTSLNSTKEALQKDSVIQSKAVSYSNEGTKVVSNDVDLINCTVNLQSENGEIYPLKVGVSLKFLEDATFVSSGISYDNQGNKINIQNFDTKENALKKIVSKLEKEINSLPDNVKNDLYNEVSSLNLVNKLEYGGEEKTARAYYNPINNSIAIISGKFWNNPNGITSLENISSDVLMHEIGHAIDNKSGIEDSEQSSFTEKFKLLKETILRKYPDLGNSHYLSEPDEAFAELVYSAKNGSIVDDKNLRNALQSADIKPIYDELYKEGLKIIDERQNYSRAERIGFGENLNIEMYKDKEAYGSYQYLFDFNSPEDQKYSNNPELLLKAYYEYLQSPALENEDHKAVDNLMKNPTENWIKVEKFFQKYLNNFALIG